MIWLGLYYLALFAGLLYLRSKPDRCDLCGWAMLTRKDDEFMRACLFCDPEKGDA